MQTLRMTTENWELLRTKLREEYPLSWTAIRSKMKEKLGFTPRQTWSHLGSMTDLDFFSEKHKTLFLIKYSNWIDTEIQAKPFKIR
jgi:hypothetical protein